MPSEKILQAGALLLWLLAMTWGFTLITRYEGTAGADADPPTFVRTEPAEGTCRRRLMMFAHPQCPCTRASLTELAEIMAVCRGEVKADVYFLRPAVLPADWKASDIWSQAQAIAGVQVHADHDGKKARELGARTSGQFMVFDVDGRLLFSGGITGSRGHQGNNPGRQAVIAVLQGRTDAVAAFPVFGCPLLDPCSFGRGPTPAANCCEGPLSCQD